MGKVKGMRKILISGFLLLILFIMVGCLSNEPESNSIVTKANEAVAVQIKWLDEQKFKEPETSSPLQITVSSLATDTHRIGRSGGEAWMYIGVDAGGGAGGGGGGGGGGG